MSYRRRTNPLSPAVVDLQTARRAVAQVAAERDALAQQLQRAQAHNDSLRRQLESRSAENTELSRAVRALQARRPAAVEELEGERGRVDQANVRLQQVRARLRQMDAQLAATVEERDLALAERDRAVATLTAAQAEARERAASSGDASRVQQLAADLANLRRHQHDAIERGVRERTHHLLIELVAVRDSLQRALDTLPAIANAWYEGLLAVIARVDHVLKTERVELVGAPGEVFDPQAHEAVGVVAGEKDRVIFTVSSGLVRADGTVLLPAKVMVGGGE